MNDTQLEYNAMSAGVLQLLQARRDQIATARAYVELLRDYWVLRAEAAQLVAGRLPVATDWAKRKARTGKAALSETVTKSHTFLV
ncbi:MAG: hypothetical protein ABI895_16785 [Deltaproteobacteria bacterium]